MERGSGTLLATAAIAVVVFLGIVGAVTHAMRAEASRVTGAADLVAVSAAEAQLMGRPACEAARRAGAANRVTVVSCRVAGDEVEYVVSVEVASKPSRLAGSIRAAAHAGAIIDAPR